METIEWSYQYIEQWRLEDDGWYALIHWTPVWIPARKLHHIRQYAGYQTDSRTFDGTRFVRVVFEPTWEHVDRISGHTDDEQLAIDYCSIRRERLDTEYSDGQQFGDHHTLCLYLCKEIQRHCLLIGTELFTLNLKNNSSLSNELAFIKITFKRCSKSN